MTFQQAIQVCFSKYADFNGRAGRPEFWFFFLFQMLVYIGAGILGGVLAPLVWLGLLLPNIAVQVRRLHDHGRSGWWCLLHLVPVVGFIILVVWYCQRGTVGANAYGADPVA